MNSNNHNAMNGMNRQTLPNGMTLTDLALDMQTCEITALSGAKTTLLAGWLFIAAVFAQIL